MLPTPHDERAESKTQTGQHRRSTTCGPDRLPQLSLDAHSAMRRTDEGELQQDRRTDHREEIPPQLVRESRGRRQEVAAVRQEMPPPHSTGGIPGDTRPPTS